MAVVVWAGVGMLGGVGALLRFLLDAAVSERAAATFPWGTLAVNLTGALVLGVLVGADVAGDGLLLAGTATLGSYTTFSTWLFESHRLGEDGRLWLAAANVALSLSAGVGAALLGRAIGGGL